MTTLPIAHVSHWLVNVLYLVPLVVIIGMLAISSVKDRRAEAAETAAGGPPPDELDEPDERGTP